MIWLKGLRENSMNTDEAILGKQDYYYYYKVLDGLYYLWERKIWGGHMKKYSRLFTLQAYFRLQAYLHLEEASWLSR